MPGTAARTLTAALALLALLGAGGAAAASKHSPKSKQQRLQRKAAPHGPLGHAGRWITDSGGRGVVLPGPNMVYKRPPHYPAAGRFGARHAPFPPPNGVNTIPPRGIHKGVQPSPRGYPHS